MGRQPASTLFLALTYECKYTTSECKRYGLPYLHASGKKIQNTTKFCRSIESLLRPTDHKVTLTKTFLFTFFFFPAAHPLHDLGEIRKKRKRRGWQMWRKKKQTRSNSGKKKKKLGTFFEVEIFLPRFRNPFENYFWICVSS